MEFFIVVLVLVGLVALYFGIGIFLKFALGWLPMVAAILLALIVGIFGGWLGAVIGLIGIVWSIAKTNEWQGSPRYLKIESSLDKWFFFGD